MLKRIGISGAALFAMLTCIQPVSLFAADRDGDRHNSSYADARNDHERHDFRNRVEPVRRDRNDRDRDWQRYHRAGDRYIYGPFCR